MKDCKTGVQVKARVPFAPNGTVDKALNEKQSCVACNSRDLATFYQCKNAPVSIGTLWPNRLDAINCRKGDITLALCHNCGLITNIDFDPELIDYYQAYDNSLDYSSVFRSYAQSLAQRLIDTHKLHGKQIIDIGCGNGQFLRLLCELGDNCGVGYDPSHDSSNNTVARSPRVRIVSRVYSGHHGDDPPDFICCRQVLEHISTPKDFLESIRSSIGKKHGTGVFFEVPNMMHTLRGLSVWTIIYEHCVYYSAIALAHIFEASGFEVHAVTEGFDAQFLGIEAYPSMNGKPPTTPDPTSLHEIAESTATFQRKFGEKLRRLHDTLLHVRARKAPVVIWGAGARAVSLLNCIEDPSLICAAVDINPNKHGKFLAGTGHEILSPESLRHVNPAAVIVMNEIYTEEISKALRSLRLESELILT